MREIQRFPNLGHNFCENDGQLFRWGCLQFSDSIFGQKNFRASDLMPKKPKHGSKRIRGSYMLLVVVVVSVSVKLKCIYRKYSFLAAPRHYRYSEGFFASEHC